MFRIFHPGTPRAKGRPRATWGRRKGSRALVIRTYTPETTRQQEASIADVWDRAYPDADPLTGPVMVTVIAVGGQPDTDNHVKLCLDALNTKAYEDDRQVKIVVAAHLPKGRKDQAGSYIQIKPLRLGWELGWRRFLQRQLTDLRKDLVA